MKLIPAVCSGQPQLDTIHHTDALTLLRALPDACVDAVITDPPYAEINRDYGRFTEADWMQLMKAVTLELRRVLKPSGSAALILQANSEKVGRMRGWLWEYMAWCCREWNMIQDVYWWNTTAMPNIHAQRGLMRPSVKTVVWLGSPDCSRSQSEVLWTASDATLAISKTDMALRNHPSAHHVRPGRILNTVLERGGSTPFNLIPIPNTDSTNSGGANGHGAATPAKLVSWWIRYISPIGGIVLDPFMGSGTTALEARLLNRRFIGSEQSSLFVETARKRLAQAYQTDMFYHAGVA